MISGRDPRCPCEQTVFQGTRYHYAESALPAPAPNWHLGAEEIMRMLDQTLLEGAIV